MENITTFNVSSMAGINVSTNPTPVEIAMLLLSCVIALVSNLFVMYLILTVPRLKTVTNVFVFSICIGNITFAVILLPMHCFGNTILAYHYIVIITVLIYICNLTAVSYDRLVSITNPMLYSLKLTKQKAMKIVIAMWILPIFYGLLPLIWIRGPESIGKIEHKIYTVGTLVVFLLGPLAFIIFVYIKVCIEMKRMNDFKRKSLTPTRMTDYCRKRTNEIRSFRQRLGRFFTSTTSTANGVIENEKPPIDGIKNIPTKLFYKIKGRQIKLHNSMSIDESEKSSQLPDALLPELTTSKLDSLPLKKTSSNSVNFQCVTFVSLDTPSTPDESTNGGVKTELLDTNDVCRTSSVSIAEEESDADTVSITSRFSCAQPKTLSPNAERKRQSSISRMKQKAYELKASLAFLIVALTYMFTWLPVLVMTFNGVLEPEHQLVLPKSVELMSLYAIALNALSDPFLYGLLLPNFRKTLKIMLRRLTLRLN